MQILLATGNQGKLEEFQEILGSFALLSVTELPIVAGIDPEETGETFEENALIKAHAFGRKAEMLTLADDSGLEVVALAGKPGVKSARWVEGSDHDRNQALLKALKGQKNRAARFVSVLCLYNPMTGQHHFFEGEVKGRIIDEERGKQGFGYDPLFVPEGYDQTFGELPAQIKNELSHRGKSLQKLKQWLEKAQQ